MTIDTNKEFRDAFSHRLSQLLERSGFEDSSGRQVQLATLFGVSAPTIHKWLAGSSLPEPSRWPLICETLHCTLDELFLGVTLPTSLAGYFEMRILDGVKDCKLVTRRILVESSDRRAQFQNHLLYYVTDNMMEPFVMMGDAVLVDPNNTDPEKSDVMLIAICNHLIVRRVQAMFNGEIMLITDNSRYESELLPKTVPCHDENATGETLPEACPVPRIIGAVVGRALFNR